MNIQFLQDLATMSEGDFMIALAYRNFTLTDDSTIDSLWFKRDDETITKVNRHGSFIITFLTEDAKNIHSMLISDEHDYKLIGTYKTEENDTIIVFKNNEFGIVVYKFAIGGGISIAPVTSQYVQACINNCRVGHIPNAKSKSTQSNKGCLVFATLFVLAMMSIFCIV